MALTTCGGGDDTAPLRLATVGTAPLTASNLLITEVNANAAGGDFFELFNDGTAAADLTGSKRDDDSASFNDTASATLKAVSMPAGGRRVGEAAADATALRAASGLSATVL